MKIRFENPGKKWWLKYAFYQVTTCLGIAGIIIVTNRIISLIPVTSFGRVIVSILGFGGLLVFQYLWFLKKAHRELIEKYQVKD